MPGRTRAACRWGSLAFSAAMLAASVGALARSADDRRVKPDSPAMRAVYAQPLASEIYPLLLALEKLRYAADPRAAALERHLALRALAALGAAAPDTRGTIADLAANPPPHDAAAIARILGTALRGQLASVDGHDLLVLVENRSGHGLERYQAFAKVERPNGGPIVLECSAEPAVKRAFEPGEWRPHRCQVFGNRYGLDEYFRGIAQRTPGLPIAMEAASLRFVDPAVAVWREGAAWHGGAEGARSHASLDMRALDCGQRGACVQEMVDRLLSPPLLFIEIGVVAGIVAGVLVVAAGGRRWRNAAIASVAFFLLGGWAAFAFPGWLGYDGYGAMILFVLALAGLAASLTTFWLTLAVATFLRRRREARGLPKL